MPGTLCLEIIVEEKVMKSDKDIRWEQRFNNFEKAFHKLDEAVTRIKEEYGEDSKSVDEDSFFIGFDIIKEGLIQRFEYTHELAWNVMKDFLEEVGELKMYGSKDATKEAFSAELIDDGEIWMEMIKSRNKTTHTYNQETADEIFQKIMYSYHPAFTAFKKLMESKQSHL